MPLTPLAPLTPLDLRFEDLLETGLALTHERCEALRETVGLVSKDKCGHAEHKRDFAALVDALRLQKLRELPVKTENMLLDPDLNEKLQRLTRIDAAGR